MARPKRHIHLAGTYFATSRTWQSRAVFKAAPPCEIFVESLLKYRDQGRYRLHAFVLMPDHFHAILTPAEGASIERGVQFMKGGSSRVIGQRLLFRFPVWQPGFTDHRIRDRQDYDIHLRYLEQNPVKRNLASSALDYRWSSASQLYQMDDAPQGLKPLSLAAGRHG